MVAKRLENDRLLLTVESEDGAVLATFKQRVPEIDLLVDTGDHVTLGITSYEPFVEDPKILGVKKAKPGYARRERRRVRREPRPGRRAEPARRKRAPRWGPARRPTPPRAPTT